MGWSWNDSNRGKTLDDKRLSEARKKTPEKSFGIYEPIETLSDYEGSKGPCKPLLGGKSSVAVEEDGL